MTEKEMIDLALAEGVSAAEMTDTKDIVFDPMFRPFCAENLCGQYGVNYCCPPDCGTPEEMKQRILAHKRALVLQTIWEIPDISDNGLIKPAKKGHNAISGGSQRVRPVFSLPSEKRRALPPPGGAVQLHVRLLHLCAQAGRALRHGLRLRGRAAGLLRDVCL